MNFLAIRSSKTFAATYDGFGRLLTYSRTGDPAQTNVYNGVDDRVSVTSGSTTRKYLYDGDGRQLGEYGASATAPVAETIWLSPEVANDNQPIGGDDGVGGYAPLAVAVGSGSGLVMQWVHGNHLGVPLVTTNASGAAIVPTGYTMPGFPGQTRTLSDIYYNRYRDYDSSTGRYIQADPIGLEGGSNIYVYADGNPINAVDTSGLAYFALRPLSRLPWLGPLSNNPLDNRANTAIAHEELFFEGSVCGPDLGFFGDGRVRRDDTDNHKRYHRLPGNYDDAMICEAARKVRLKPYKIYGYNCQAWADEVRSEYWKLARARRIRNWKK